VIDVMNENVGSITGFTTLTIQFVNRVDRLPVRPGSAAQWVYGEFEAGGANDVNVHNIPEVLDIGANEVM
jgi:hypothetical protein